MEPKEVDSMIGARVRKLRKERKVSLREMSASLDISYVFLGELERGDKPWKVERLEQVAQYFNIPASLLYDPSIPLDRIPLISALLAKMAELPEQQLSALETFLEALQRP